MTKTALLKKLDAVMTEVERTRMYGEINIVVRNGEATVLRTLKSGTTGRGEALPT
jgi:hypothetical protein